MLARIPMRRNLKSRSRPPGADPVEADGSSVDKPQELQEKLLDQIAEGAGFCAALERRFGENPAPELELLIKLCRVLLLKFSLEANKSPAMLRLLSDLVKPVMDWARLEEKRKEREFAEQKYREQSAAQRATSEKEQQDALGENALKSETLEKIERELKLF